MSSDNWSSYRSWYNSVMGKRSMVGGLPSANGYVPITGYDPHQDMRSMTENGPAPAFPSTNVFRSTGPFPAAPIISGKPTKPMESYQNRKAMIAMRLNIPEGEVYPFDYFDTHNAGTKVFVFLVVKGQSVVLEDDAGMFPSDHLITQLRLLL